MLQYADDEVNDEWDDDFVFADEGSTRNNDVSSEEGFDIDEDSNSKFEMAAPPSSVRHDDLNNPYDDIGAMGGTDDDIPMDAIGFDDISDEDEFDNDEPLALDIPVPNSSNRNSNQHLSMTSKASSDRSSTNYHHSLNSKSSISESKGSFGSFHKGDGRTSVGDTAAQSVSSGTKSVAYDRLSTGSESGHAKSTVDYGKQDDDDDDDDDWNQDFMGHGAMSADDNRSIRQSHPFYLDAEVISAVPDKESLLDFLDSNVKRQVLEHSKIFRSSLTASTGQDDDASELANHHLRGVFGWSNNVLEQLQSFCTDTSGARSMNDEIWEETVQISPTEEFIHQTMDLCEQNPFRESNLYSLEIVAKWLSGYCVTTEFLQQSNIVIAERICIACLRGMGVLEAIKGKINSKMMDLIFILKEEQSALFQRFTPSLRDSSQNKVMERVFENVGLLATIVRVQSRFTEVQLHLGLIDDYNAVLERIESALEFLDIMVSYIEVVRLCIPLPSGEGFKTAQDYLRTGVKQEELIFRTKVTAIVKSALASSSFSSIFYHRYEEKHIQMVCDAVADFSGMFLTVKLLFMSRISPLTLQPVVFRLLQQQVETRRLLVPYNVAYDMPVGTQCKDLMQRLESPSIVRARLSYALFHYIDCLLKRKLVWQADRQRGVFFKKRRGFLRRTDSDLTFGIDAADAFMNEDMPVSYIEDEITKSLADSFGSSNELSNQQLFLLLEVAVDLFPKSSANPRPGEKPLSAPSGPFSHATFPLNFLVNIIDNIKDPEKLWILTRKDGRFSPSFRSQMFHFSYAFVSDFADVIHDQLPILAFELIRLQFTIFKCISGEDDDPFLLQKAFFLAVQLNKSSVAVQYGETLWVALINQGAEAERVLYTGSLLATQYEEEAQYELAIRVISNTMMYIKNDSGRRPFKKYQLRLKEEKLDDLAIRLAICFIHLGDASSGIKVLQTLFGELCSRPAKTLFNDEKRITALSWLLQAYTDLADFDSSNRLIKSIKAIRQERLEILYEQHPISHSNVRGSSAMNLSEYASVSNSSSSINSMSGFLFAYGTRNSNNPVPAGNSNPTAMHSKNAPAQNDGGLYATNLGHIPTAVCAKAYRFQWNSSVSSLPQYCITSHSMDLGKNLAEVYFNSGLYVSALNSLTPTIIGVEYAVRGKQGSRDGILELAKLYYFRGKIQYEASCTARSIRFPFEVGSPEVFSAVQNLYVSIPKACVRGRNHVLFGTLQLQNPLDLTSSPSRLVSSELSTNPRMISDFNYTCKRSITYSEPADLLWDAMKWFRKAWDLFHAAGDEISAAKAANRIAKCHLLPCFTSFALLNVPITEALDLSFFKPINLLATNSSSSETAGRKMPNSTTNASLPANNNEADKNGKRGSKRFDFSKIMPPPPLKQADRKGNYPPIPTTNGSPVSPTTSASLNRFVSLEEVEKVSNFSLDIHIETSLPLGLMDSYMNMAELFVLRGMKKDALLYWWEAKDLFLTLFADGCLLPILRRCSLGFMRKLKALLDRIVVFLWISDYRKARDEHVFLLEIHNIFILEESRITRSKGARGRAVAVELQRLLSKFIFKPNSFAAQPERPRESANPSVAASEAGSRSTPVDASSGRDMPVTVPLTRTKSNRSGTNASQRRSRGVFGGFFGIFSCRSRESLDIVNQPSLGSMRPSALSREDSIGVMDSSTSGKLQRQSSLSSRPTLPSLPQRLSIWKHVVTETVLSQYLGKVVDLPVNQCCCLLTRGFVEDKLFDFNWVSLKFDRVYTNGKSQICSSFSSHVKQHVLTWVDLLGEDGLIQQQTNKFLPDTTWRKMQQRAPLHGSEDFGWLNADFWHCSSQKSQNSSSANGKEFDFQSFWDIACKYHGATSDREIERVGEDLIIERLWHLLLRLRNVCDNYADKVTSMKSFSKLVRGTLLKYAGNMLRLRCFSKQFKFDLVNPSAMNALFRKLLPTRVNSTRLAPNNDGDQSTNGWIGLHPSSSMGSAEDAAVQSLFVFQQRMGKTVYVMHIGELILLYYPNSGKDYKGQFGGNAPRFHVDNTKLHDQSNASANGGGIATFRTSFPPDGALTAGVLLNRGQQDFRLTNREVQLLFDLCSQEDDDRCGGGAAQRYESLHNVSRGVLGGAVNCLVQSFRHATVPDVGTFPASLARSVSHQGGVFYGIGYDGISPGPSLGIDTQSNHSDSTFDLNRNSAGMGLRPISTQGSSSNLGLPLTLICSHSTNAIPWEALVPADVYLTRQISVMNVFGQMLSNLCSDDVNMIRPLAQSSSIRMGGFQKHVKPLFVVVSSCKDPQETMSTSSDSSLDVFGRIHNRRARSGVLAVTQLQHSCDSLAVVASPTGQSPVRPPTSSTVAVLKGKNRHSNRLKLDRLLIQRLRHGLLPLPSSLPWKGHISTLFAGGDLLTLPLNFTLDLASMTQPPSENVDGGKESESDYENQNTDTLIPSSSLVDKEFKDVRFEVHSFCKEFDHVVAGHVARELKRSSSESHTLTEVPAKGSVDRQLTVMVLTYCDLVEMNNATLALLTTSRSSFLRGMKKDNDGVSDQVYGSACCPVIIFAPSCVQERLVVELKLALDRWQRGDSIQFAAQSFDFSGGGSVYSKSSGHSSIHSMSMSPMAHNASGNSIGSYAQAGSSRSGSRWPSLRSRSASIDRSSSGSRGNSKLDMHSLTPQLVGQGSNHSSINSQYGNSLVNILMPTATLPHKDSGSISSFFHSRSRHSNDSMEPFSHLDRVDSGSLAPERNTNAAAKHGLLSTSNNDISIPGRIIRTGSGVTIQSRPGSGNGGGIQLPPPPPPLSLVTGPSVDGDLGGGFAALFSSPSNIKESSNAVSPHSIEKYSCDPCLIIAQVVRRIQLEHAVSISIFV